MPFGHVDTRMVLDEPNMIYCGTDSEVKGHVIVDFKTRQLGITELFGPVEIFVVLTGRAKSKITVKSSTSGVIGSTTATSTTYRGRAPLVWTKWTIQQGPIRIRQGESQSFPFAIRFPDKVQSLQLDRFDADPRFDVSVDGTLPPSMSSLHHSSECFVEYLLSTEVHMPSIDVRIHNFGEEQGGLPVYYEQARVPISLTQAARIRPVREIFKVSNEFLLPEDRRPVGFRERAKARFKSDAYPMFVCSAWIEGSANLQLGQPIKLELRVPPHMHETTVAEMPEIKVSYLNVTVRASTMVRAERGIFSSQETSHSDKLVLLSGSTQDRRPFSKANDWTKEVTTVPLTGMPSTFSTFNIARTYSMDVELCIEVATKTKKMRFDHIPVRLLPPALEEVVATAASSAVGSVANQEVPPSYQDPPSYDEKNNGAVPSAG